MNDNELLQAMSDMIDKKLLPINSRLDKMDTEFNRINNEFDRINNEFDKLNSQVSALRSGQIELRKELKEVNIKVTDTYNIALDAWGTSIENRKWLEKID